MAKKHATFAARIEAKRNRPFNRKQRRARAIATQQLAGAKESR